VTLEILKEVGYDREDLKHFYENGAVLLDDRAKF
jgi:hypothetical protein